MLGGKSRLKKSPVAKKAKKTITSEQWIKARNKAKLDIMSSKIEQAYELGTIEEKGVFHIGHGKKLVDSNQRKAKEMRSLLRKNLISGNPRLKIFGEAMIKSGVTKKEFGQYLEKFYKRGHIIPKEKLVIEYEQMLKEHNKLKNQY